MQPHLFIRTDRQYVRIAHDEIICIEAEGNYTTILTKSASHLVLLSLRQLEKALPEQNFCRVSRKCIIALDQIVSFDTESVNLKNNKKVSLGEKHREILESRVNIVLSDVRRKERSERLGTISINSKQSSLIELSGQLKKVAP